MPLRRRPLNRRYIVVEGIYANTGLLAPLDKMIPLKHKCVVHDLSKYLVVIRLLQPAPHGPLCTLAGSSLIERLQLVQPLPPGPYQFEGRRAPRTRFRQLHDCSRLLPASTCALDEVYLYSADSELVMERSKPE